jgi:hypothetical protein
MVLVSKSNLPALKGEKKDKHEELRKKERKKECKKLKKNH